MTDFRVAWSRRIAPYRPLLDNAVALLGSSVVTSGLGFVYWWVAARLFSSSEVGVAAAVLSAMQLLGMIAMLGLDTLLLGELPKRERGAPLVAAATWTAVLVGAALGLGFAAFAARGGEHFSELLASPLGLTAFTLGVGVTAVALVLDQALVGRLAGGVQLARNALFAASKLGMVAAFVALPAPRTALGLLLTWVLGVIVSFAVVGLYRRGRALPAMLTPSWSLLRGLGVTALAHHALNFAVQAPRLLIPVVIAFALSARDTAFFYTASLVAALLVMLPASLTTTMYVLGSKDPRQLSANARVASRLTWIACLIASVALALLARPLLSLFGAEYAAAATTALMILAFTCLPSIPKFVYVMDARLREDFWVGTAWVGLGGALEIAAAYVGARTGGLIGCALGVLAASLVQALFFTLLVRRTRAGGWGAEVTR